MILKTKPDPAVGGSSRRAKKMKKEDAERNNAEAEEEGEQSPRKKSKKAEFDWEEVIAELLTKKGGKMKVILTRK